MRFKELLTKKPKVEYLPEFDPKPNTAWYGIKALWFEGATYQGKKTKVFAYIGYPEEAKTKKVPAVVLVHGGEGHAFPEWIRKWNEKGFAAIAMDTTGFFPNEAWRGLVGNEEGRAEDKYERRLYGQLLEKGYTVGPNNTGMEDISSPLSEQWMYHAVEDTILAHNVLLGNACVDSDKIGICGISWGAVITSLAIGYDTRYAFAIPIYGSAYLDVLPASQIGHTFESMEVKKLWAAADRLKNVNFPVLWQCWLCDWAFSIVGNSLSYEATKEVGAFLSISPSMGHGHVSGWVMPESYRFARKTVDGELPLIKVSKEPEGSGNLIFEIEIPKDFEETLVAVYYITRPMEYDANNQLTEKWSYMEAELVDNCVHVQIPEDTHCYFVEFKGIIGEVEYLSNTKLIFKETNK